MELKNKVGIVTGAARGLGKAIALTLVREGCTYISDILIKGKENIKREVKKFLRLYNSCNMQ